MEWKFVFAILVGQLWLVSSLFINFLSLVNTVTIKPFNKKLGRTISDYLTYILYASVVFLVEFHSKSKIRLFFADKESEEYFNKEHLIAISNHTYEVDWLWIGLMVDKFKQLGAHKAIVKNSLKYVPIVGWCWYFCEFIFLSRDWNKDRLTLNDGMDNFMGFDNPVPIFLFCEGTRFTKEKYAQSVEYSKSKGIKPYKHHLNPRGRGFVHSIMHLSQGDKLKSVYNVQVAFHKKHNKHEPTLLSVLKGLPLVGDVYLERIPIKDIDASSEETATKFLDDIYRKKDNLMDHYLEEGKFPGIMKTTPPGWRLLVTMVLVSLATMSCLICLMAQSMNSAIIVTVVLLSGTFALKFLVNETKAKKSTINSPKSSPKLSPN